MENQITFTQLVKEEICMNTYDSVDRVRALLAAFVRITGSLNIQNKKTILSLKSENVKIAKFIYQQLNEIYNCNPRLEYVSKGNTKKTIYYIHVDDTSETIVDDLEISFLEGKISKNIVRNDDTISGYLAGAFLASGSINSPKTSNYHLEISLNNENYAKWLSKLFSKYKNSNIEPKIICRREKYVIYFKKSDQISNFLIMIGAVSACMEFENVRVDRDFSNSANRLANSDLANMKKTYETAQRQIEEIKYIDQRLGLINIDNRRARLLAQLRFENETASLNDLAKMLSNALKTNVSKSSVNNLFRILHSYYERIK